MIDQHCKRHDHWTIVVFVLFWFCLMAVQGCTGTTDVAGSVTNAPPPTLDPAENIRIGEAIVGDGNEVANVDVMIGRKDGPVGAAFANALARQTAGHINKLAVLEPNLQVKPSTVIVTMVTITEMTQAVQMLGPAQMAVAKAVTSSVEDGVIPKSDCEALVIVCGVFLHPSADDEQKIFKFNFEATRLAISRAMTGEPNVRDVIKRAKALE